MMQIQQSNNGNTSKKKYQNCLHIDMTPMVDLGFLLICFFVITTSMLEKKSISLSMPKAGEPLEIAESKTMTLILLKENKVMAYEGMWETARSNNAIVHTSHDPNNGLRKLLRSKQVIIEKSGKGNGSEMVVLIKPLKESSYANLVSVLDEMLINGIKRYAVIYASEEEKDLAHKFY